jgi:hypothetical protein
MAAALTPMMEYLIGVSVKLAQGENLTAQDKDDLKEAIRDTFIASVPLVTTALGGPIGGFFGTLLKGMFTTMVSSGTESPWESMKSFINTKQLQEDLLNLEARIFREMDRLEMFAIAVDGSTGNEYKNRLIELENKLDTTYMLMIFRTECVNSVH